MPKIHVYYNDPKVSGWVLEGVGVRETYGGLHAQAS